MTLLILPLTGGFSVFNIKHISSYVALKQFSNVKGLLIYSSLWILIGGALLTLIAYFILPVFINDNQIGFYRIGLGIAFMTPIVVFTGAVLRGLKHVVLGRLPNFTLQPILFLGLIIWLYTVNTGQITLETIIDVHLISLAIAILLSLLLIFKYLPKELSNVQPNYEINKWFKSVLPLIFSTGLIIINSHIDIIMVGALASETEAGFYRTASRLATFVPFFLLAANSATAPYISSLHTEGKKAQLQNILTVVARLAFIATLPLLAILIIWPEFILTLLFGHAFAVASTALIILTLANFFNVAMGQVGQVMALTGHERLTAYTVLIAVIINIGLNYILVPQHGINGAAIATGVSIIIWNGLLAYWTVKKTGYVCHILGKR